MHWLLLVSGLSPAELTTGGLFVLALEPWLLNWGSTRDEQAMLLPGDTADPSAYFTRVITINRPLAEVWPWLLQIGQDGAVRLLETNRVIGDIPGRFVLVPAGDRGTRLLLREQLAIPERSGSMWLVWDPMHFVMEQRMLQGIKERVEDQPLVPGFAEGAAHVGWTLAGLGLVAMFLSRRGWRFWLTLPVAVSLPALLLTGDLNAALAGFLAAGITVGGALAFGWRWWPTYLLEAFFLHRLAVASRSGRGSYRVSLRFGKQTPDPPVA
jgi:hypothetical protein